MARVDAIGWPQASQAVHDAPGGAHTDAKVHMFGTYLVDADLLREDELHDAITLVRATNAKIGELAVERGVVTRAQADHVNRLQREFEAPWGEIARSLGLADARTMTRLLARQDGQNIRLADAIVDLGFLSATEVEHHYQAFEASLGHRDVLPSPYDAHAWIPRLVGLLPRLFGRILDAPLQLGHAQCASQPSAFTVHKAVGFLTHDKPQTSFEVALHTSAATARSIAQRLLPPSSAPDSDGLISLLTIALTQVRAGAVTALEPQTVLPLVPALRVPFASGLGDGALTVRERPQDPQMEVPASEAPH